jgi:hypothetical protein
MVQETFFIVNGIKSLKMITISVSLICFRLFDLLDQCQKESFCV